MVQQETAGPDTIRGILGGFHGVPAEQFSRISKLTCVDTQPYGAVSEGLVW